MFLVSAEAKTSAGAPWVIGVTGSEDPAKLSVTLVPGFLASKSAASWVNVAFRDAAANTVSVPDRWEVAAEVTLPAGAAEPQALRAPASPTATSAAMCASFLTFFIRCPSLRR